MSDSGYDFVTIGFSSLAKWHSTESSFASILAELVTAFTRSFSSLHFSAGAVSSRHSF